MPNVYRNPHNFSSFIRQSGANLAIESPRADSPTPDSPTPDAAASEAAPDVNALSAHARERYASWQRVETERIKNRKISRYLQEIEEMERRLASFEHEDYPEFPDLSSESSDFQASLALVLATQNPVVLLRNTEAFSFHAMDSEVRNEMARILINTAVSYVHSMLAENSHLFHAKDLELIADIGYRLTYNPIALTQYVRSIEGKGDRFALPKSLKWQFCGLAARAKRPPRFRTQRDLDSHNVRSFSYRNILGTDEKLWDAVPEAFKDACTILEKETDHQIKKQLECWLEYTAQFFININLKKEQSAEIEKILKALLNYRSPIDRYNFASLLGEMAMSDGGPQDIVDLSAQFKSRLKATAIILHSLDYRADTGDVATKSLLQMLNKDVFKVNTKTRTKVTGCLLRLALEPEQRRFSDDRKGVDFFPKSFKRQLLQACLPKNAPFRRSEDLFVNALQDIDCLLLLFNIWHDRRQEIYAGLHSCHHPGDFHRVLERRILELFQVNTAEAHEFLIRFDDYNNNRTRYYNGLIVYATKLQMLPEPERAECLEIFNECVRGMLFKNSKIRDASRHMEYLQSFPEILENWLRDKSREITADLASGMVEEINIRDYLSDKLITHRHAGEETYPLLETVLRNEIELSQALSKDGKAKSSTQETALLELLRMVRDNQSTREKIQQVDRCMQGMPASEFSGDMSRLKDQLKLSGQLQNFTGFTVVNSGDMEDRFLANTEVPNCQAITGDINYNKCLLNELSNSAERFYALKAPNGKIAAHRTVRLLVPVDPKTKLPIKSEKPVWFLETGYDHDVPYKLKQYLVKSAVADAKASGCILVTKDRTIHTTRAYPYAVASLGSPAPWAYIDSADIPRLKRHGEYVLYDLRIVE